MLTSLTNELLVVLVVLVVVVHFYHNVVVRCFLNSSAASWLCSSDHFWVTSNGSELRERPVEQFHRSRELLSQTYRSMAKHKRWRFQQRSSISSKRAGTEVRSSKSEPCCHYQLNFNGNRAERATKADRAKVHVCCRASRNWSLFKSAVFVLFAAAWEKQNG